VHDDIIEHQDEFIITHSQPIDLKVLYKTLDYQVIIKPRGVLSHPTSIWELSQPSVV
jgi:23S rRNA-/tRNA-specific pseudouridylate synthase